MRQPIYFSGHQKKAEMLEKIKVLADDVQKEVCFV